MNNSIPLILASKSKPRRDVLFSAGICPLPNLPNIRIMLKILGIPHL